MNEKYDNYELLPDINMVNLNSLNSLDRVESVNVLKDVYELTTIHESLLQERESVQAEILEISNNASKMREAIPFWELFVRIGVYLIAVIVAFKIALNSLIVFAVFILAAFFINKFITGNVIQNIVAEKNNAHADAYLNDNLPEVQQCLFELEEELNYFLTSDEVEWGMNLVGEELFFSECVKELINYIETHRCDSIKEALNKYDVVNHEKRMEGMQRHIESATQIQAEEAVKQTKYARKTARNTTVSAVASVVTANNTRKINKNVKKIRRKL